MAIPVWKEPLTPDRGPACWLQPAVCDAQHQPPLTPGRGPLPMAADSTPTEQTGVGSTLTRTASVGLEDSPTPSARPKPTRRSPCQASATPTRVKRSRGPTGRRTYRQQLGQAAEDIAADFLRGQGLSIQLRNFRCRLGELDIVARDGDVLAIVEVRTRSSDRFGGAAASVNFRKQQRLIRATQVLLASCKDFARFRVRFDVICVELRGKDTQPTWLRDAFLT